MQKMMVRTSMTQNGEGQNNDFGTAKSAGIEKATSVDTAFLTRDEG